MRGLGELRGTGERGVSTALHLGVLAAGVAAGVAVLIWADASAEHSRTAVSADLAALAASDTARGLGPVPGQEPCAVASEVARRHKTVLLECQVLSGAGASAQVRVRATASDGAAGWLPLARAETSAWAGEPQVGD
ncbi:hypothetical protein [Galactobacter caseinivorans]|uniref:Helicase/secretion neighborhood TadE-like protein n=1 Tax=Galactobacter caseinivorans TaxID=2676123 RepID=A0A496PLB3_9MICC|nr:hypothetical protein [Galactobacter caseinivorans]RKW71331.1 hypothetical protein DWQ67_00230 [Galactobacter caseinivorans]